jgi:hypothetical protein
MSDMILEYDRSWGTWFKIRFSFLYSGEESDALRGGVVDIASQTIAASETGDVQDRVQLHNFSIHPFSFIAVCVAITSGICLIYTVVFVPVSISFYFHNDLCEGTPYDTYDLVVETVFLFEICMTWFIGRYKNGEYLGGLGDIAYDYVWSGQLAFDCLTSIPIGWIEYSQRSTLCVGHSFKNPQMDAYYVQPTHEPKTEAYDDGDTAGVLMLVKIIKPLRLLRLVRLLKLLNHKALKALNEILDPDPDTVRLLTVVACVFIICHFTGSLFWLVKSLSNDPDQVNEFLLSKKFEKLWFCGKKLPEGFEPCEQSATWYVVGMWLVCLAAMRRLVGSTHTNRWVGI